MRGFYLGFVVTLAVLFPTIGNAQVFQLRTPPPDISAAADSWQINSEPIMVGGLTFYPTRGFRLFDAQILVQTGQYEGVPVYADSTIEPNSELYVPLGSGRMRVYERRREGELAGTTGSHLSTFPVDSPSVPAPRERSVEGAGVATSGSEPRAIGTGGALAPRVASDAAVVRKGARPGRVVIGSAPKPANVSGVWLEYDGARYYSNGAATSFSPDRFEPMGEYHGFPVYRDKIAGTGDIWVSLVKDGPLAPYTRR